MDSIIARMPYTCLGSLDVLFIWFHTGLMLFNLLGWLFKPTRKANLATLLLTAFSWFVLGLKYGLGYCFCTDWHWQVRYRMGFTDMPDSYVKFLIDLFTGLDWNARLVDTGTAVGFILALGLSCLFNVRDFRNRRLGRL